MLISFNFHVWIASIKLWFKFKYECVRPKIVKMADKVAATYQFARVTLVIYYPISSKFHIWITFIKLCIWAWSANQNGLQNGTNLSVCTCGLLVILISPDFFQISYLLFLSYSWPSFEYGFCPMNDNKMAAKMAVYDQFALVETLSLSFII